MDDRVHQCSNHTSSGTMPNHPKRPSGPKALRLGTASRMVCVDLLRQPPCAADVADQILLPARAPLAPGVFQHPAKAWGNALCGSAANSNAPAVRVSIRPDQISRLQQPLRIRMPHLFGVGGYAIRVERQGPYVLAGVISKLVSPRSY